MTNMPKEQLMASHRECLETHRGPNDSLCLRLLECLGIVSCTLLCCHSMPSGVGSSECVISNQKPTQTWKSTLSCVLFVIVHRRTVHQHQHPYKLQE